MNNDRPKAIVAVSGGLDSCVTASIAKQEYEAAFAHINYGQLTENRELRAFNELASFFGVTEKLIIDFTHLSQIGGSSLTDTKIELHDADLSASEIPNSYVPFRNANILTACVSWAEVINAEAIYIGAVFEDSSGYPDCRPEFFESFEKTLNLGTKPSTNIKIKTPIIHLRKDEIIKKGIELNSPLHLTWSCYRNQIKACGKCVSCALRLRGFQRAGVDDPVKYAEMPNYK